MLLVHKLYVMNLILITSSPCTPSVFRNNLLYATFTIQNVQATCFGAQPDVGMN